MTNTISCMVVDDDRADALVTQAHLNAYPFMEVIGTYHSAEDALLAAKTNPPDCLFLDIDMPKISGLELRAQLLHIPACVFITYHSNYAVEGFETAALDFLVKPITPERFKTTINRLQQHITLKKRFDKLDEIIFIKDGHTRVKLHLHEIIYLEALDNYTGIVTSNRKYTVLSSISSILKESSFSDFVRIHRSYAVQKQFIGKISSDQVMINGGITLPVGRTYKRALHLLRE